MSYEVGASTSLRAEHVMPVEGPEGRLHAHEYRVEVLATRSSLDRRGMVIDLDVVRAVLRETLDPLRDTDLGTIAPPGAEGVTVEILARWIWDAVAGGLAAEGAEGVRVRVWESQGEFAGYTADVGSPETGAPGPEA
jgi:6-pyruvoyltetrahydropterin/6-carboxytetrahydropterin synthase